MVGVKNEAKAVFLQAGSDERQLALDMMRRHAEAGGRIFFGTVGNVHIGVPIGRSGNKLIVVMRRATREEFLMNAPAEVRAPVYCRTPFYWEAELGE